MNIWLHVCHKDEGLVRLNLEWLKKIGGTTKKIVVTHDSLFDRADEICRLAAEVSPSVEAIRYDPWHGTGEWPGPQNWAWSNSARGMARFNMPWFWWEADATPLVEGAFERLAQAYKDRGRPFMGPVVKSMGHMNGVAVYPPRIVDYSTNAMLCRKQPFDVFLSSEITLSRVADCRDLIHHVPRYSGVQLSVTDKEVVEDLTVRGFVFFHGCNDGSLPALLLGIPNPVSPPKKKIREKLTLKDLDRIFDESKGNWQRQVDQLTSHGYADVAPYEECVKDRPRIEAQTKFKTGILLLGNNETTAHFNTGIVRHAEKLWAVTRRWTHHGGGIWTSQIVVFALTEDLQSSSPFILQLPKHFPREQHEDPRILSLSNGRLALSYSAWVPGLATQSHQALSFLAPDWTHLKTLHLAYGRNGMAPQKGSGHEKNWIWFNHGNKWHFVYAFAPMHTVIEVQGEFHVKEHKTDVRPIPWIWGDIRGGTPPVWVDGLYWTFFHSSLPWRGKQNRYYMGAYAFEGQPPFKPVKITKKWILAGSEENVRSFRGPPVVFACGAVYEKGEWLVTGGSNDEETFWIKMSHKKLEKLCRKI